MFNKTISPIIIFFPISIKNSHNNQQEKYSYYYTPYWVFFNPFLKILHLHLLHHPFSHLQRKKGNILELQKNLLSLLELQKGIWGLVQSTYHNTIYIFLMRFLIC